jgi:signal transduction histidine kinase
MHRLRSIRIKATAASLVVIAVALAIAGVGLVNVLRTSQIRSIDTTLELRATDIESLISQGGLDSVSVDDDEDSFVQIIDADGTVVASSTNVEGEPRILEGGDGRTVTMPIPQVDTDDFRVHVHLTAGEAPLAIVVGTNLENVNRVQRTVRGALALALPVIALLMAAMIWLVIGRALRPVEAIRSEVADIGGGDLHRRVPVPATQDEIGRLASTMNSMLDRLESSSVAQAQFVSDASHELRTPIAVIRHELEVALRSEDGALPREIAIDVLDEDLRMQRLVEDLLLLARRDGRSGHVPRQSRTLVDLDDVVLGEAHRVKSAKAVDTSHVSAGPVRGDPDHFVRIVRNLLDNALRHAASRVALAVATTEDGYVVLDVDDDGPGVSESDRAHIFERFGRADESRNRDDGGSGLGLAIVAGLVGEHGGTVSVGTSPALGGARFTVRFIDANA